MIADPERTVVISSQGWVDHAALWSYDVTAAAARRIELGGGAHHVTLHASGAGRFAAAHHWDGARFELTVHDFSEPGRVLARASVSPSERRVTGDALTWKDVPLLYLAHLRFAPWDDFVLLRIVPLAGDVVLQRPAWYDARYDKDYQGLTDVLELADENLALVSVQRSSRVIVHDLATGMEKGHIDLGGRAGNPRLQLRNRGQEIWASDYDTLVAIRRSDLRVLRRARLQGAAIGTQQFIGEFAFAPDDGRCVVARPFSGDVVEVDAGLRKRRVARLGRQPLEVAALHGGEVVARDWKTGEVLRGVLQRRWFLG